VLRIRRPGVDSQKQLSKSEPELRNFLIRSWPSHAAVRGEHFASARGFFLQQRRGEQFPRSERRWKSVPPPRNTIRPARKRPGICSTRHTGER